MGDIFMDINQAEKFLKVLANRRRLKIIKYLSGGKKASVSELAEHLKLSFKSTSKHLLILKSADIVDGEQVSLARFYYLTQSLDSLLKSLAVLSNSRE